MTSGNALQISSTANPRIKNVVRLRERSDRDEQRVFPVEGYREIKRALDNNVKPVEIFFCPELYQGHNEPELVRKAVDAGAIPFECSRRVFEKIAYRDRPEGVLAVVPHLKRTLADVTLPDAPLIVVVEAIEKPGNLGTILRSADAAGVHAVIVCDRCTDIHNPNVVRASIGTLFSLPVVETDSASALKFLAGRNVRVLAATPHAKKLYTTADMKSGVAIVLGSEQYGLKSMWLERADEKVRIPMLGQSDSLNVAAAGTILLYEAVRQRGALPK